MFVHYSKVVCSRRQIDRSGRNLRPGVIDYFEEQNITVNGQSVPCILATVRWFQSHPSWNWNLELGAPVEVRCKDIFELEGGATFIPVKRLHGKFIPTFDIIERENVLVFCPLPCKLHC